MPRTVYRSPQPFSAGRLPMKRMHLHPMSCASWFAVCACTCMRILTFQNEACTYQLAVQCDSSTFLFSASRSTGWLDCSLISCSALRREVAVAEVVVHSEGVMNFFLIVVVGRDVLGRKLFELVETPRPKQAPERKSCLSTGRSNSISFPHIEIFLPSSKGTSTRVDPIL